MVERTKPEIFDEFVGTVVSADVEPSSSEEIEGEQYHLEIKPEDENLLKDSKTGLMHEWIRIPPKATENTVPEGSVADRYIQEIETIHSDTKKMKTHAKVFATLLNNKYLFKKKKLGKAYKGHEAKNYWIPVELKEESE